MTSPRIVVISSLFPSEARPTAGLFIRERMFRVARRLPLVVVSPQPWFPFQGLIRLVERRYRPRTARHESQSGIDVYFPRFFAIPALLRRYDGLFMALGCLPTLLRLRRTFDFSLIDAHFAYPDGYAASLLGRWLDVPVTLTLRGTEPGHLRRPELRRRIGKALQSAARVFAVSDSLRSVAIEAGARPASTRVIGNGVDTGRFSPMPREEARARLGVDADARVIVSVGGLVERKGFHRVIDVLPALLVEFPRLHYLIVGGPSPEGDMSVELRDRVRRLGLERNVAFLGAVPPDELRVPLSAADLFVLATRNEGWANVLLEAMAVGIPVVTTDVGGNREVVSSPELGTLVPFGDERALAEAIAAALRRNWNARSIRAYAEANAWEPRVEALVHEFESLTDRAHRVAEVAVDA